MYRNWFQNSFFGFQVKKLTSRRDTIIPATGQVRLFGGFIMGQHIGSTVFQVNQAFSELKSFGQSKHNAKENYKETVETRQIDKFMAGFGKEVGIFSYQTYKDYLQVSVNFANYAKQEFMIKDISKLTSEHVKAFLESKSDLSRSTIQKYSAVLEKFESALSIKYNQTFNFNVKSALPSAVKENLKTVERAGYSGYADPQKLVNHIQEMNVRQEFKLASRLQLETGIRGLKDVNSIRLVDDKVSCITKGGKIRELKLSDNLKSDLKTYLAGNNFKSFKVEYKEYLSVLKRASVATEQKYEATHGLRHNFYDSKALDLQRDGMLSVRDSWKATSREIGHNRIVSNYTR